MADHLRLQAARWNERVVYLSLQGELTYSTHEQFDQEVQRWFEEGAHSFVFDLSHITLLSNTGGGTLVNRIRASQDSGGRVTLIQPSPAARETLELLAVVPFLHVVSSIEEAKDSHSVNRRRPARRTCEA